jgi:hypothetical protein
MVRRAFAEANAFFCASTAGGIDRRSLDGIWCAACGNTLQEVGVYIITVVLIGMNGASSFPAMNDGRRVGRSP